jgi:hypothetical protein
MKKITLCTLFSLFAIIPNLNAQTIYPAELQIKTAVLSAPLEKQSEATVYGYSPEGKFIILREGHNDMVCLADNPKQAGIQTSCYFKELEPFMARGRALAMEGKNPKQVSDIREAEIKSGDLEMPMQPTTLYVYWGSEEQVNEETGEVKGGQSRYVVYIPFATSASTGLPNKPDKPGMPWIMDEGTHKAHIMINPVKPVH